MSSMTIKNASLINYMLILVLQASKSFLYSSDTGDTLLLILVFKVKQVINWPGLIFLMQK